jgi:voltage-gated potassium channel
MLHPKLALPWPRGIAKKQEIMTTFRKLIWNEMEGARTATVLGHFFRIAIGVLILLNALAVMEETVPGLRTGILDAFKVFDMFSIAVFTVEYSLRVWSCRAEERFAHPLRGRLRFMATPLMLVDLMAILPFFLPFLHIDLRLIRLLRFIRIFRMARMIRYSTSLRLFGKILADKKEELVLCFGTILMILPVSATIMYYEEHTAQPDKFSSIPAAMWWAVMTLTTVGYGDVYPMTQAGKIVASITAILGTAFFALPAAILAVGFIQEFQRRKAPRSCPHCGKPL